MRGRWRFDGFEVRMAVFMAMVVLLFDQSLKLCFCLNSEGLALLRFREEVVGDPFRALSNWNDDGGEMDPCSWFGVECSDGKVVILNLKDLGLRGTLAPGLGNLVSIRSIILRNNSFSGTIPNEIGVLRELEVLDLGYNNFTGSFLSDYGNILSLTTLLLDHNMFLGGMSPELYELKTLSEFQRDEKLTTTVLGACCDRNSVKSEEVAYRRQLQIKNAQNQPKAKKIDKQKGSHTSASPLSSSSFSPSPSQLESPVSSPSASPNHGILIPSPSPIGAPTQTSRDSVNLPTVAYPPPRFSGAPMPSPALDPIPSEGKHSKSNHHLMQILAGVIGGPLLVLILVFVIIFIQRSKVVTVKPWATGLSGQLQKAFVTGVPKLKRSELEAACEDFSNIIGSFLDGVVYKGTLSSGVEIAVTSSAVESTENWSKILEAQFRKKIATLSKVNHKNFVNLIGYCEEEKPFTRMMVFEYAPNGTLFEHLHIKEAEHLDWGMRLRIAMGMAYCLEHMHQLTPPVVHENLQSSSVYLTEDYAAKISDFNFWKDVTAANKGSAATELLHIPSADPQSNIYNFGVILLEIITGRIPFSVEDGSFSDWASNYQSREQPLREMVDPTLKSFQSDELEKLLEVIKSCVHCDPNQRPTMKEIAARLKEIMKMEPEGATPKLSPLWWAELEIMSSE